MLPDAYDMLLPLRALTGYERYAAAERGVLWLEAHRSAFIDDCSVGGTREFDRAGSLWYSLFAVCMLTPYSGVTRRRWRNAFGGYR